MKRRFTRAAVVGVILVLTAVGAVACGDDGGEKLTLEEYFQQLDQIDNEGTERIDALFANMSDDPDVNEMRDAFAGFPDAVEDAAADADDLNPPDEVKDEHTALVDSLSELADAANDSLDAAADATSIDEFQSALQSDAFESANAAVTTACLALQQIANDNSISVTLDCSEDDEEGAASPEAAAVEQVLRDTIGAWNAKDVDALMSNFTDAGVLSAFAEGEEGVPQEAIRAGVAETIGEPAIALQTVSVDASGETATAETVWHFGKTVERLQFSFVNEAGTWKIDKQEDLDAELPAGATTIAVDLNEFSFELDESTIPATGTFSFSANNAGAQPHELALAKIPEDAVIEELLTSEEDVPGFEFIGGVGPFESGDSGALVLAERLDPGRYAMVCFLPDTSDPEETPHAFKGMVKEFRVE